MEVIIDRLGGNCPVQADGTIGYVVGKSRCPKCGCNSLVREKDGWKGAKPRIVCAYVGCREVVSK
jgi:hypothetical protein